MPPLYFVTSNPHKVKEAKRIAQTLGVGVTITQLKEAKKIEIQSNSLPHVVRWAADHLKKQGYDNFFVEDAGLFISRLNGFPGVFSHYVFSTIGAAGILTLMESVQDRTATFKSVVALIRHGQETIYEGVTEGQISTKIRGSRGFGFDPIFSPTGETETFGEMDIERKNRYSHRGKSIRSMLTSVV